MSERKEPTIAQQLMGDFAPKLAELTDDVLFGDVWERSCRHGIAAWSPLRRHCER